MLRWFFVLALAAAPIAAQLSTSFARSGSGVAITFTARATAANNAFSGGPYCAQQSFSSWRPLSDGTRSKEKPVVTIVCQDSAGRKRTERKPPYGPDTFSVIDILDPVENAIYIIDPAGLAHRVKISANMTAVKKTVTGPPNPLRTVNSADGTTFTIEGLETKMIDGFLAAGVRTSTHYPVGSKLKNDKPLDLANESWQAVQLGTTIYSKGMTAAGGENFLTLDHIVSGEPDPAKMRPPAGYRVVDETGPFTVTISQ